MSKPNFIQKAAEFLGFSTERVEKMTAEEKSKLESFGEKATNLETERDQAIEDKTAAEAKADQLQASLDAETQKREAAENTVKEKEAEIKSLNEQMAKLPGAESTTTVKQTDETIPTEKDKREKVIRSWERPLYDR